MSTNYKRYVATKILSILSDYVRDPFLRKELTERIYFEIDTESREIDDLLKWLQYLAFDEWRELTRSGNASREFVHIGEYI